MKYQVIARAFADHGEAVTYANSHLTIAVSGLTVSEMRDAAGEPTDSWQVFELVPATEQA